MKHLKTYESLIKNIYRKGDVVLIKDKHTEFGLPYAKILRRDAGKAEDRFIDRYYVEIIFPNTKHWAYHLSDVVHTAFIEQYYILRKLSKKEKKELELKLTTNKYNI